jgi:hypothetical protein
MSTDDQPNGLTAFDQTGKNHGLGTSLSRLDGIKFLNPYPNPSKEKTVS